MKNKLVYAIVALAFVGGIFATAYAGPSLITITFEGFAIFKENVQMDKNLNVDGEFTSPTTTDLQNQISNLQTALCNPEICDGLDNDCDGSIDEEGICILSETNCSDGIDNDGDFEIDCADLDCETLLCNDDGLFCNGIEICQAGSCVASGEPCPGPDGDNNCQESCDELADNCLANDPDLTSCGQSGEFCDAGVCIENTAPMFLFLETPTGTQTGPVSMTYTIADFESDLVSVNAEYFTSSLTGWIPATPHATSDPVIGVSTSPSGISHTFVWDSEANIGSTFQPTVIFRMTATDDGGLTSNPRVNSSFEVNNS